MRKLILATLLLGSALFVHAQSGTNSPYSQFGLGTMTDQASGFNRGMNGVGLGFHEHNQVNYINPASYASLDSLTFIFDVGMSGQITNFAENGVKKNAKNANFEYAVAGFRAAKHVGVSFGIIPFTNVGYDFSSTGYVDDADRSVTYTNSFNGDGGFHEVYLGAGWSPVKGLSIGANVGYFWGKYSKSVVNQYSNSAYKTLSRVYSTQVNSYKLDFGAQYTAQLAKKDQLTVALTFSPGHNLGSEAKLDILSSDANTADTTSLAVDKGLSLPTMWGAGLMWNHNDQWKVGFDYTLQKWGSLDYPLYSASMQTEGGVTREIPTYALKSGYYSDRHKVNLGVQYCYGERNRSFFKRIQYHAGASYATPYYKVNGNDGPKELSVSAGFGIPIFNSYNNRSYLNISGQWVQSSAKNLIKENTFRLNIGFTFNEDWFKKWKMQ